MKRNLILLFVLALVGMNFVASAEEEPRRADGMFNVFFIHGGRLTTEIAEQFNIIMGGDLHLTDMPDSYYSASIVPGIGVLRCTDKSLIKAMFPEVKEYSLNGNTVTEQDFYAVPGQMLTSVTYSGDALKAETRNDVNDGNPYSEQIRQESLEWYDANLGHPMPANVALNDPDTYFEDPGTIVTLDYIITSPAKVKEKQSEIKGYVMCMLGPNPQIYALTNENHLNYFGLDGDILGANIEDVQGPLTPANIAAQCNKPLEDLIMLKADSKTIYAYFKKP